MSKGTQQVSQLLSAPPMALESTGFSADRLTATLDGMESQLHGPSTSSYQGKGQQLLAKLILSKGVY